MRKGDKGTRSLRIVYDVDGWAFHNRARALLKYSPADFDVSIAPIRSMPSLEATVGDEPMDILFLMDRSKLSRIRAILDDRGWDPRLVVNWSNGWPMRVPVFYQCLPACDLILVNNRDYLEKTGEMPGTYYLPNGVDREIYKVTRPFAERTPRVLWVGSEKRRRLKGYDDYLVPLQAKLAEAGIEADFRLVDSEGDQKWPPEEMAEWYNTGMVVVCASEMEGTPNPALEAAACGCTIVSTAVGNMPDLIRKGVNGYIVERDVTALFRGVRSAIRKYPQLAERMQRDIAKWDWRTRSAIFFDLMRKICDPSVTEWRHSKGGPVYRRPRRHTWSDLNGTFAHQTDTAGRPDLSHAVTVFATSVGGKSFDACLHCLEQQDVRFRLDTLEYVAPLSEAVRQMLARCRTPFFVQIDEDMLLYPSAIRTLYERIIRTPPSTAIHAGAIHDVHLGRLIHGVKIFRHAVVKDYPPGDDEDWNRTRNRRLVEDGLEISRDPLRDNGVGRAEAIGCHGVFYTDETVFERYSALENRRRRYHDGGLQWFEEYPHEFLRRFLDDPTELNYFALMGVLAGSLTDPDTPRGAKDFRAKEHLEGYRIARELFDTLRPK